MSFFDSPVEFIIMFMSTLFFNNFLAVSFADSYASFETL